MEKEKTVWSLQNNKRSPEEQNAFKPTGKKPKNNNGSYLLWAIVVVFVSSYALTFLQEESKEICVLSDWCFNTKANEMYYTFYIFSNIIIVVLSLLVAYLIGKRIGDKFKI